MRFSLRLLLAGFTALAFGIAWYVMHREAEMGVDIRVPKPIALDDYYEIPNSLLEIRSRKQVRDHDWAFENASEIAMDKRIAEIRNSITWFFPDSSQHLLTQRRTELLDIARKCLAGKPDFRSAVQASLILELCDQPEGLQYIKKRFLSQNPEDMKDLGEFLYRFRKRNLGADLEIAEFLKTAARNEESSLNWQACHMLHNEGIDSEPLIQSMRKRAANKGGNRQSDSFIWLMENQVDEHTVQLVKDYLAESQSFRLGLILKWANKNSDSDVLYPEISAIKAQAEKMMCERLAAAANDESEKPPSVHHQQDAWHVLGEHCTTAAVDFFRNVDDNLGKCYPDARYERIVIASRALARLDYQKDAEKILSSQIDKTTDDIYSDDRIDLFHAAEEILGREATIRICRNRLLLINDYSAIKKLAEIFADTGDEQIVEAIAKAATAKSEAASSGLNFKTLKCISQIGSKRIVQLWKTLPKSTSDDVNFYRQWVKNQTTRQQLVDWINDELRPAQKLTTQLVLQNSKYCNGDHWIWHDVMWEALDKDENAMVEIDSDQKFATIALAHSGYGNLSYDDRFPLEGIVNVALGELADIESTEFQTSSFDYSSEGSRWLNSFVVNNRLYKFSHSEGFNGSDDRYSTQAAVEILNAVAIRQRLEGRFFCYDNEWGITLVMYLTPQQSIDLKNKFGISPIDGFEYYLTN